MYKQQKALQRVYRTNRYEQVERLNESMFPHWHGAQGERLGYLSIQGHTYCRLCVRRYVSNYRARRRTNQSYEP